MMDKKIMLSEIEPPLPDVDGSDGDSQEILTQTQENDKKPGKIARLKAYISRTYSNRKIAKQFKKDQKAGQLQEEFQNQEIKAAADAHKAEKHIKDNRRLDQYLNAIENQLDKVDEQNKMLLFYLTTVKENNEALLSHINVLTKNNQQLLKHIEGARRREKFAKIFAIISSILAIGLSVWKFLQIMGIL